MTLLFIVDVLIAISQTMYLNLFLSVYERDVQENWRASFELNFATNFLG